MSWLDDALVLEEAGQLPEEWAADLATLREAGEAPPARSTSAAVPLPAEQPAPVTPPPAPPEEKEGPGFVRSALATGVEVGGAVLGGLGGAALGAPTGPGAVLSGAAGAAAGGALARPVADWIRGEETTLAGVATSAITSAIPGGAAVKAGGGVVRQTLAHALEGAVVGEVSTEVRTRLEEGRAPTTTERLTGAGVGAVTGGAVGGGAAKLKAVRAAADDEAKLAQEFVERQVPKAIEGEQLPLPGVKFEQAAEELGTTVGAKTPERAVQLGLFDSTGHVREELPPIIDHASGDATGRLAQAVKNEGVEAAELLASTDAKNQRLYKQVAAAFHTGLIDAPGLVSQLQEHGMSLPEFVKGYYVPSIRLAGQQLQQLSSLRQHINALGGEGKRALDELSELPASVKFAEWIQRLEDTRRTLLISQVKTGVRNAFSQGAAYGTHLLEEGMSQAVGGKGDFFGSIASLGRAWNKGESREAMLKMLKGRRDLLAKIGEHEFRPANTFLETSPVLKATLGRFVNATTYINQAQEAFFRRAAFDSSIRASLKQAGYDVDKALAASLRNVPADVRNKMLDAATDKALELTFAQGAPGGKLMEKFIEGFQTARPLTTFITPFPRYMGNAFAYFVKRSPLGLARLATQHGRQNADKVMAETMSGTMLFSGALALRYSEHAGEKWYQIKTDDGEEMDVRGVLGPLAPFLFAADAAKQYLDTGRVNYKGADVVEGILSMSRLTGTASTMLSWMKGDVNDAETWGKGVERMMGEWFGGFSVPARNIKDAMTIIGQEQEGTYRDIRESPLSGPTLQNIPLADRTLPEAVSVTRGTPMKTEHPIPAALLGLNVRSSTPLENTMERLNLGIAEVAQKTGYPKADRELHRRIGKMVAVAGPLLVNDEDFQALGPEMQKRAIKELFTDARKVAMDHLERTNPKVWAVLKAKGELTADKKAELADAGIDVEAKLQAILDSAPEGSSTAPQASKPEPASPARADTPALPPPPPADTSATPPPAPAEVVRDGRLTPEVVSDIATIVGLEPELLSAVLQEESSGGRVGVRAPQTPHSGGERATGPMQMLPKTFREEWADQVSALTGKEADVDDPLDNLIAGALMYRKLLDEHGDVATAARFYHGGPNTGIHGPLTRGYGERVAQNYRRNRGT